MKASELRIGNWIESKLWIQNINKEGFVWNKWQVMAEDIPQINDNLLTIPDQYRPIPLTEEWLLKFGFDKDQDAEDPISYFCQGVDFIYNRIEFEDGIWVLLTSELQRNSNIQYVHQLQNLYFALTGEELLCAV